jgi:hypothetical protein
VVEDEKKKRRGGVEVKKRRRRTFIQLNIFTPMKQIVYNVNHT